VKTDKSLSMNGTTLSARESSIRLRRCAMFKPKILYPYHYGKTDPSKLVALMEDTPQVEIRIRKMP